MNTAEKIYNDGYNQGMDHALKLAQVVLEKQKFDEFTAALFVLELKDMMKEVKEIQSKPVVND